MDVHQRLDRLEATEAIKQLKALYFRACDTRQPELVRQCFPSGEIDLRYECIGEFNDRYPAEHGHPVGRYLRRSFQAP